METRERSGKFFVSDVQCAAETMAYALKEHGLTPEEVVRLAGGLEEFATYFFNAIDERPRAGDFSKPGMLSKDVPLEKSIFDMP